PRPLRRTPVRCSGRTACSPALPSVAPLAGTRRAASGLIHNHMPCVGVSSATCIEEAFPMGRLRVTGTIDVGQFWPGGESDADTTKVLVSVSDGFEYHGDPAHAFRPTHAFDGAEVHGKIRKTVLDNKGRVTIRLQGIDAPELHYQPQLPRSPKPTDAQHA